MWISRSGSGSGREPTPEQIERWHRRTSPPDNEFPAAVGTTVLLGRTEDVAIGLSHVESFSTGFQFALAVRVRQARPELATGGLLTLIGSHHHFGLDAPLENRLLLGVEYPDGRRTSTLHDPRMDGPGTAVGDAQLILVQCSGEGGELSVDQRFWVTPLPPDGPVTVVIVWPGFGIEETRSTLDGAAIRAAAGRSRTLWPARSPLFPPAPAPAPPPRPDSGWFAEPPD
jgi:hypothetical protein